MRPFSLTTYRYILLGVFLVHFAIVLLSMLPRDWVLRQGAEPVVERYIRFPFTRQSWDMFAPPPKENFSILVRASGTAGDTARYSKWIDLTRGLNQRKHRLPVVNTAYASIDYFLFNCKQELMNSVRAKAKAMRRDAAFINCEPADYHKILMTLVNRTPLKGDIAIHNLIEFLHRAGRLEFSIPIDSSTSFSYRYVIKAFREPGAPVDPALGRYSNIEYYQRDSMLLSPLTAVQLSQIVAK